MSNIYFRGKKQKHGKSTWQEREPRHPVRVAHWALGLWPPHPGLLRAESVRWSAQSLTQSADPVGSPADWTASGWRDGRRVDLRQRGEGVWVSLAGPREAQVRRLELVRGQWSGGGNQGAHLGWGRSRLVSPLSC